MATKTKAGAWSFAEAMEQLPSIRSGITNGVDERHRLRAGRSLAEHDAIIRAIPHDPNGDLLIGRLAIEDHADAKAARAAGKPIPATPYLEELTRRNAMRTSTTKTSTSSNGSSGRKKTPTDVRFTHDGKLVSETQNKLSSVAWFYTKPLGKGGGRMKVNELKALLVELGVKDPNVAGWSVKLPNGVTLGAVKAGETPTPIEKPKADKPKATTAKKATAKATAPKRPSGQRYTEGVTPKKATPKKAGAASKPLAKKMAPRKQAAPKVTKRSAVKA